jgi:hypothetical protein
VDQGKAGVAALYIIFGLALLSMCFQILQENVMASMAAFFEKLMAPFYRDPMAITPRNPEGGEGDKIGINNDSLAKTSQDDDDQADGNKSGNNPLTVNDDSREEISNDKDDIGKVDKTGNNYESFDENSDDDADDNPAQGEQSGNII